MTDSTNAWAAYQTAKSALRANQAAEIEAGIDYETSEYLNLNAAVVEAEQGVPAWLR